MAASTTLVFVPGAWHSPEAYDEVASKLQQAGYTTDYVTLPSVGPEQPHDSLQPDADHIREHVLKAIDAGQKVMVVAHSYGGIPTCEAVHGLDFKTRQAEGKPGGVTHLFFIASFIISADNSLIGEFGGTDLPWFDVSDDKMWVRPMTPENIFYNGMPDDQVQDAIAKLKPHCYQTFHSKLNHASWAGIPSTYMYCLQDNAIPMFVQEMMVKETAKDANMRTETLDTNHSPFFTMPDECVAAIQRAAELPV